MLGLCFVHVSISSFWAHRLYCDRCERLTWKPSTNQTERICFFFFFFKFDHLCHRMDRNDLSVNVAQCVMRTTMFQCLALVHLGTNRLEVKETYRRCELRAFYDYYMRFISSFESNRLYLFAVNVLHVLDSIFISIEVYTILLYAIGWLLFYFILKIFFSYSHSLWVIVLLALLTIYARNLVFWKNKPRKEK